MNVLPLVLALLLTLTVLTVQKMEIFKNQSIVQHHYQQFFKEEANLALDKFQKNRMQNQTEKASDQVSFKLFINKEERQNKVKKKPTDPDIQELYASYRSLMIELMRDLYSETQFYQEIERRRPDFLKEIIDELEQFSEDDTSYKIQCKEDLAKVKFQDPQLQYVFYLMLKGTVTRSQMKALKEERLKNEKDFNSALIKKSYPSLLDYIRYNLGDIKICLCPRETLQAIFGAPEIAEHVIARRHELGLLSKDSVEKSLFVTEFKDKVKPELKSLPLDFSLAQDSRDYSEYD